MRIKLAWLWMVVCLATTPWAQESPAAPQCITPLRMMKARWENRQLIPLTAWMETGSFAPAGGCTPDEQMIFNHLDNLRSVDPSYHNPYWVNDIRTLVSPLYHGARASALAHTWFWNPPTGSERCYVLVFTTEQVDAECQVVHESSFLELVVLDYGVIPSGMYYSEVCLAAINGLLLPATPADDGNPGTVLLGGYGAMYARSIDSGILQLASRAQPVLGYPSIGTSAALHWSDDNPPGEAHTPAECYQYIDDDGRTYGGAMAFWAAPPSCTSSPDVDGSGCVDDADLLIVLFNFGNTGNPGIAGDANCDGNVDDADLLDVLFNFGRGCQ